MVDDAELVRATRDGDVGAFTAIFDRHAARVHDVAWAMLRDRGAALEVVETSFLEASLRLLGLEQAHRLPVWLLAVTRRNAALRSGPTAGPDRQPSLPNDDPERSRLATLVWEAVADLPLRDRTLIDLDLRQGLDGQDLADAMGVTVPQAFDLQARLRDRIEKGLSGYLIARTAEGRCLGLTKVLKGWDGRFTPKDSGRIAHHVESCQVCNQIRFSLPSPFVLYAAALPAPFPAAARPRVLERVVLPARGSAMALAPFPMGPEEEAAMPYQHPLPAPPPPAAFPAPAPVAQHAAFSAPAPVALPSPAPAPWVEPPTGAYQASDVGYGPSAYQPPDTGGYEPGPPTTPYQPYETGGYEPGPPTTTYHPDDTGSYQPSQPPSAYQQPQDTGGYQPGPPVVPYQPSDTGGYEPSQQATVYQRPAAGGYEPSPPALPYQPSDTGGYDLSQQATASQPLDTGGDEPSQPAAAYQLPDTGGYQPSPPVVPYQPSDTGGYDPRQQAAIYQPPDTGGDEPSPPVVPYQPSDTGGHVPSPPPSHDTASYDPDPPPAPEQDAASTDDPFVASGPFPAPAPEPGPAWTLPPAPPPADPDPSASSQEAP